VHSTPNKQATVKPADRAVQRQLAIMPPFGSPRACRRRPALVVLLLVAAAGVAHRVGGQPVPPPTRLSMADTVRTLVTDADRIMDILVKGSLKGQSFNRTATFCDTFGHRMVGTPNLEASIDWVVSELQRDAAESGSSISANTINKEPAHVPYWQRGCAETARPCGQHPLHHQNVLPPHTHA
jgi:hypothetical protein